MANKCGGGLKPSSLIGVYAYEFRYVLKVENFRDWRRSTVRLFQARGPATARARSPMRNDQNSNDLYIICKVVVLADYIQSTKILLVHELSV